MLKEIKDTVLYWIQSAIFSFTLRKEISTILFFSENINSKDAAIALNEMDRLIDVVYDLRGYSKNEIEFLVNLLYNEKHEIKNKIPEALL